MLGTLENHRMVALGGPLKSFHSPLSLNRWANVDLQKSRNLPRVTHVILALELEPRLPALCSHGFFPSPCQWKEPRFSQDLACWLWWMGWKRVQWERVKFNGGRASLMTQWLRLCLPMQGTRVWSLVREDPTCHGAAKPVHHNYWTCVLEPVSHNYWAHEPQLLKLVRLEPVLHNKRSHLNEKPAHCNEE